VCPAGEGEVIVVASSRQEHAGLGSREDGASSRALGDQPAKPWVSTVYLRPAAPDADAKPPRVINVGSCPAAGDEPPALDRPPTVKQLPASDDHPQRPAPPAGCPLPGWLAA